MLIYHGTHTGILPDILMEGLQPRNERKGNWRNAPSHSEYVYFTLAYPLYFAAASIPYRSDAKPVIVEVDMEQLDEKRLCPDEDYIAQGLWQVKRAGQELVDPALRRARTLHGLSKKIEPIVYQSHWKASLEHLGQVAYLGTVPPEAIMRYAIIDPDKAPTLVAQAMQPDISIQNYSLCGTMYRSLVAFLFDGTDIEDPFADGEASYSIEYAVAIKERQRYLKQQREEGVKVMIP